MRLLLHINNFEIGYRREKIFQMAQRYGCEGVELRYPYQDTNNLLRLYKVLKTKYNLSEVTFDVTTHVIGNDREEWFSEVELMKERVVKSASFGLTKINCVVNRCGAIAGSHVASDKHFERAAEAYREIGKIAKCKGILIVFEMHTQILHDVAEATVKLLDMISSPNVKANFDPGNIILAPHAKDVLIELDLVKKYLGYLHLKNIKKIVGGSGYIRTCIDDGDINYYHIFRKLHEIGYDGDLCVENTQPGDATVQVRRDIEAVRLLWEETKKDLEFRDVV